MNKIKLRAFEAGKMVYEKDITHLTKEDNNILRLARFLSNIRNDSILMLWSGETDRDGAEIYDGDLIKIGAEPGTYEVRFHAAAFLVYEGEKQIGLLGELKMCFLKRVGNIYE